MAIDGVEIIDSDTAHDIYYTVVEGYRDGEKVEIIIKNIFSDEADIYEEITADRKIFGFYLRDVCDFIADIEEE